MSLKNELQLMLDTYAEDYRARDLEACLAFFDENCRFITPRGVMDGKGQVEKLHRFWVSENRVEREMQVQQIEKMGDHVYAIWRFSDLIVDPASNESTIQKGTALGVIRLDPDDGWLIVACSSNADADVVRYPAEVTTPKSAA